MTNPGSRLSPNAPPTQPSAVQPRSRSLGPRATVTLSAGTIVLICVVSVITLPVLLWIYLAVSLMPRPWDQPTTPLPPLLAAVEQGDVDAVNRQLAAGDAVDAQAFDNPRWPDGTTALMIAASHGDADIAALLLESGATVGLKCGQGGDSAIHWTTASVLPVLLEHGADVHARNRHGQTPLTTAAVRARGTREYTLVRQLLEAGADKRARDDYGRTAVEVLKTWHNPDTALIKLIENWGEEEP